MCGIYGGINLAGAPLPLLRWDAAAAVLRHRGPDGQASWEGRSAVLGLVRLAVHEPREPAQVAGAGPVRSVCNGEFYNHATLRRQLPAEQCPDSAVDTALVPALYAHWGESWVQRARGMYAAALHDVTAGSLHLWRDPLGKKPLFYAVQGDVLVFASEAKGILATGFLAPRLTDRAVQTVLQRGCLDEDTSPWEGIRVLPPGGWLRASRDRVAVECLLPLDAHVQDDARMEDRWVAALDRSVQRRSRVHVAAEVLLSGGMDSALVAQGAGLPCTTVAMPGDESPAAARMARRLGVPHTTVPRRAPTPASLRRALWHLETPDVDSCWDLASGVLALAQDLSRRGVKVALSGEGADELFLGYPWQRVELALKHLWRLRAGDAANVALPDAQVHVALARHSGQALRRARSLDVWRAVHHQARAPLLSASLRVLRPLPEQDPSGPPRQETGGSIPHVERALQLEALQRDMLQLPVLHADRLMMAFGVEARLPFLDLDLVRVALRLPAASLSQPRHEKPLLRALHRQRLGRAAAPKRGFTGLARPGAPQLAAWATEIAREGCQVVDGAGLQSLAGQADSPSAVEALWRGVLLEELARVITRPAPPELD